MTSGPSRQVSEPTSEPCDSRVGREAAGAGRLERPKAHTFTCFRDRLLIRPDHSLDLLCGALGGVRTHGLVPTKDALFSAELQGQVSRRHDSNV